MTSNQLSFFPSSVARILGIFAFTLACVSVSSQFAMYLTNYDHVFWFLPLVDLNKENNIPSLFSTIILFFAGFLLLLITSLEKKRQGAYVARWQALSFGFIWMAVDECLSLHEKITPFMRDFLRNSHSDHSAPLGLLYNAWVIPAFFIVLVCAIYFFKFWWNLAPKTRYVFALAAIVFLGGCLGVELPGGSYAELHGQTDFAFNMVATVEECMEMAGVILFIWGLLTYLSENFGDLHFRFNRGDNQTAKEKQSSLSDNYTTSPV